MTNYRRDIDGLRAIAVSAVIAFHLGWLEYGYLGVDVFLVISGYLITSICLNEARDGRFSIWGFYVRRTRRILPLTCVVVTATLIAGCFVMLPDDLENLAQSVIATNLCANNVLQAITTKNYWDVINEYKPLMHTWSLGIEEQFYVFFPLFVGLIATRSIRLFRALLLAATAISLGLFLFTDTEYGAFYLIQYRAYELATGCLLASYSRNGSLRLPVAGLWLAVIMALLVIDFPLPEKWRLLLVVASTAALLASDNRHQGSGWAGWVLGNPLMVSIGLMSFSLYMWHQVLLAFVRYYVTPVTTPVSIAAVLAACVGLSWISWQFLEQPFRDVKRCSTAKVLAFVGSVMLITTGAAAVLYLKAGVIRDVPELDLFVGGSQRGMHSAYNHRIFSHDREFSDGNRVRVMVVGSSFMRDWANVLLESPSGSEIEVAYGKHLDERDLRRARRAGITYVESAQGRAIATEAGVTNVLVVGPKNFGTSNGIHYNHRRDDQYCLQRVRPDPQIISANDALKSSLGAHHIDLLARIMDSDGQVPVFTPDCRFISQDTRHLTQAGARYFAHLFAEDIAAHIAAAKSLPRAIPGNAPQ